MNIPEYFGKPVFVRKCTEYGGELILPSDLKHKRPEEYQLFLKLEKDFSNIKKLYSLDNSIYLGIRSIFKNEDVKIKILAKDKSLNENFDLSDLKFSIDSTKPEKILSKILDLDENWKVDTLKIVFSENILDSSVIFSDFSLSDWYIISSFEENLNWDISDNNEIYFSIPEKIWDCNMSDQSWCDTDVSLVLNYLEWSLTDIVWNKLETSSEVILDGVKPVVLWREFYDIDWNWIIDQVKMYFSETMDASQVSNLSFDLQRFWWPVYDEVYNQSQPDGTILILWFTNWIEFETYDSVQVKINTSEFQDMSWNSAKIDSEFVNSDDKTKPIFKSETFKTETGSSVKITFSENIILTSTWSWSISDWLSINWTLVWPDYVQFNVSDIVQTWITPLVQYLALWNISDWSLNFVNTWSSISEDRVSPEVISAETLDLNSNWNIDTVKVSFSEDIFDSLVEAWDFSLWFSSGTSFTTWNTEDDDVINLNFSNEDSWTGLKDLLFNWINLEDLKWNKASPILSGDLIETDKAWPVIVSAYYVEWAIAGEDEIVLNFSEDISDTSVSIWDFSVEWTWSILNWTILSWSTDDNQIKIELNPWDLRLEIWTSKIRFSWVNKVSDLNSNLNTQILWITVNWSVIINEVNWAGSSLSEDDEYIELRNMWANPVDLSNYVIENASAWGSVIIPSWKIIPWNWYFLISNFPETDPDTVLNVAPDYSVGFMNLSNTWNWDLILKDSSWNIMDTVEWDTWLSWDSIKFYSMERYENPWDWLWLTSWYTANWRENLDSWTEKW